MTALESGDRSFAAVRDRTRDLADGVTLAAGATEFVDVEEPFTGEVVGQIPACTEREATPSPEPAGFDPRGIGALDLFLVAVVLGALWYRRR